MRLEQTELAGVHLIHGERFADERGVLVPLWSRQEFAAHGLETPMARFSLVASPRCGTLRGMHWQEPPHADAKIVCCLSGAIYDVVVDVREHSPTFGRSFGVRLAGGQDTMLYCPEGCAHGFVTLTDDVEVVVLASGEHAPDHARGARWDDPFFAIAWPLEPTVISERDRSWPDFQR